MNLDLANNLLNNLKENKIVQNFIKELSKHLESASNNKDINNDNRTLQNTGELTKTKSNSLKQEGCLYQVIEVTADGAYLQNTSNNKVSEETNIPKDILNRIEEDSVLRFKDGQYVYEEELTEKFRNSLIGIKEYMDIKQKFINETNIYEIAPNTEFKIESYGDDYCLLSYGNEIKNTIEVPKALIPFWAKNGDTLCYKDGKFERNFIDAESKE